MGKTVVVYVKFIHDVACQKILNLTNDSRSCLKNKSGTFLGHNVDVINKQKNGITNF